MSDQPTLRQLEYLVALAEHLNFRRAAESCYVTQPTLSNQLKELEGALGVQLFERDKRRVLATPAGELLTKRAREVLRGVADLVDQARAFNAPLSGPLRLGVIPTIAPYLLPNAMPRLRERFPELQLYLWEDHTDRLLARLAEGQLDLLLLAREAELGEVALLDLFRDSFLLAAPHDHPLAKRKRVRQADLDGERLVLLQEGHCLRAQALTLCSARGAGESREFQASSLSTLIQTVAAGSGITLLPKIALEVEGHPDRGLAFVPFSKPEPARTISLAWRRSSPREAEFRALGKELSKHT
tara:strand:- start:21 stop:917 length:897 start_codon:yes stop_codon:yes gene_type:complete